MVVRDSLETIIMFLRCNLVIFFIRRIYTIMVIGQRLAKTISELIRSGLPNSDRFINKNDNSKSSLFIPLYCVFISLFNLF